MAVKRKPKASSISLRALEEATAGLRRLHRLKGQRPQQSFKIVAPPPGVLPDDAEPLAMDSALSTWAIAGMRGFDGWHEGMSFIGYPELAVLAQRAEYRVVSETIAEEQTRKWIRFASRADDDDGNKVERIQQLEEFLKRIGLKRETKRLLEQDGFFGRSHLYLDTGATDDPDELKLSIGDGRDKASAAKVTPKHPLLAVRTVEAVWCYPTNYNSIDPLKPDWYTPSSWFSMGKQVHSSRLIRYVAREVPDMLKPAYSFGGLSMSQMLRPYVDNWLRTRQSVADIISSFSVFVLMTNLMQSLESGGDQLFRRAELFNTLRDNAGVMMLDKDTEDFKNVSASLATLDVLQAQTQEHMAAVARIPLVKLLGIQPAGLNADSETSLRAFYDTVAGAQEKLDPIMDAVIGFAHLSLWGEIDEDITWEWMPLRELTEKEEADINKTRAETGEILIGDGTLHPEEERKRLAADPTSRYDDIDVEDVPEPEDEEIEPKNVRERVIGSAEPGKQEEVEPAGRKEAA
jgi:uncharacterized protein